jgi:hypothetical protein
MTAHYAPTTCHHIFTDAHRCGSPALRGERFCYFHHPTRLPVQDTYARRSRRGFDIATPTDPAALQQALHQVIRRLAANKLDVHRAGLLLYSLQIAAQNLNAGAP